MSRLLAPTLQQIAEVAGEAAAIALAAQVGGTRVYIPARVGEGHWLVECVGRRAADAICRHYAVDGKRGTRLDVPLGTGGAYPQLRRAIARRIHQLDGEKQSSRAIAARVGVSQRTVHKHRAAHRGGKQGELF